MMNNSWNNDEAVEITNMVQLNKKKLDHAKTYSTVYSLVTWHLLWGKMDGKLMMTQMYK